jgi:phosphoglycolate phosphatase-like HAD superfamily hydrolase
MVSSFRMSIYETVKRTNILLKEKQIIFWDFDGVIKDSLAVKSLGYEKLFLPFGAEVVKRVNQHHKAHGGVSRFEKIPLYLNWAGESANAVQVQEFCAQFSELVQQAVIDSPWVPGVYDYLSSHHASQCFILITATPQGEIEQILDMLEIVQYFREVHGAPKTKTIVVNEVLSRLDYSPEQALIIGDSKTDLKAAEENNVVFLLRRTPFNNELQQQFQGYSVENLNIKGQ